MSKGCNIFQHCIVLQSHASQRQCGLTSPVADRFVSLVQKTALLHRAGEFPKLYGAASVGHADSGRLSVSFCVFCSTVFLLFVLHDRYYSRICEQSNAS